MSMIARFRHSRLLWVLPFLYLMTGAGVAHGVVLCRANDHFAIEPPHGKPAGCEAAKTTHHPLAQETLPGVDRASFEHGQAGCVDIVLISGHGEPIPVRVNRNLNQVPQPPFVVSPVQGGISDLLFAANAPPIPGFFDDPIFSLQLVFLRTIVLLI
ncbi:hypothetical protein KQH29_00905 [bacterium]|nr:hypothetical protein [bacterium]